MQSAGRDIGGGGKAPALDWLPSNAVIAAVIVFNEWGI